jgi:ABC-type dipeptide/oligopeptide/nickel transport system permease component
MLRFLFTRLSLVIPTFIGMTLLAFFLIRLVPGDPIETMAGERGIDPVRHAALLKEYGLDRPVLVQYGIYIGRVLHGDLGKSMITQTPVCTNSLRCSRRRSSSRCARSYSRSSSAYRRASSRPCGATRSSTTE